MRRVAVGRTTYKFRIFASFLLTSTVVPSINRHCAQPMATVLFIPASEFSASTKTRPSFRLRQGNQHAAQATLAHEESTVIISDGLIEAFLLVKMIGATPRSPGASLSRPHARGHLVVGTSADGDACDSPTHDTHVSFLSPRSAAGGTPHSQQAPHCRFLKVPLTHSSVNPCALCCSFSPSGRLQRLPSPSPDGRGSRTHG